MTKSEEIQESACELADAHWEFVKECIDKFSDADEMFTYEDVMGEMEWGFKKGFVHGFKHGKREGASQ